jgi:tRNA(adenine34) deaminase
MTEAERFMGRALTCAKKAAALGEVPVGAVVVRNGTVISTGYNRRESGKNALLHAEMVAINRACKKLGGWRLFDCDLYVTLEPCPMCSGAIINSRIRTVYIGAHDPKAGCMGSVCDLTAMPLNHKPEVIFGLREAECASLLTGFFRELRQKKKEKENPSDGN